jgi:hypothetical protein
MFIFVIVFSTLFVAIVVIGVAISWGIQKKAEIRLWQEKYRQIADRQNNAAWRANKEMIMY